MPRIIRQFHLRQAEIFSQYFQKSPLTETEVANRLGVSQPLVSQYLNARLPLNKPCLIIALCQILDIPIRLIREANPQIEQLYKLTSKDGAI